MKTDANGGQRTFDFLFRLRLRVPDQILQAKWLATIATALTGIAGAAVWWFQNGV